ncbi:MAG: 23S rRNA (guanosine(2251)-2'-O)-methyltransferase RlmB [Mycobacteriales bacterium]
MMPARAGSGGQGRRRLAGKGPTPPARRRPGHPVGQPKPRPARPVARGGAETVVGRNPVLEALRAGVPARSLFVVHDAAQDSRLAECVTLATQRRISVVEVGRRELDAMADGAAHQGIALAVAPYRYAEPGEVLERAAERRGVVVALDGVTDARNLGAVVRSAAAFGAHGVIVPERRSAGVNAGAWKASAGAVARLPVASATNLVRVLREASAAGFVVVGLDGGGAVTLDDLEVAVDPLVLVVGSESKGLSRLVREACDLVVRIPLSRTVESLNAGIAAAVVLAEVARRRRLGGLGP